MIVPVLVIGIGEEKRIYFPGIIEFGTWAMMEMLQWELILFLFSDGH